MKESHTNTHKHTRYLWVFSQSLFKWWINLINSKFRCLSRSFQYWSRFIIYCSFCHSLQCVCLYFLFFSYYPLFVYHYFLLISHLVCLFIIFCCSFVRLSLSVIRSPFFSLRLSFSSLCSSFSAVRQSSFSVSFHFSAACSSLFYHQALMYIFICVWRVASFFLPVYASLDDAVNVWSASSPGGLVSLSTSFRQNLLCLFPPSHHCDIVWLYARAVIYFCCWKVFYWSN